MPQAPVQTDAPATDAHTAAARGALVLFSGGQDSSTCLAWALQRFNPVETVAFDYGQRHRIELDARLKVREQLARHSTQWAARMGADHLIDLKVLGAISETALTRDTEIRYSEAGLPNTFVPARNLIFLTMAAALAYRRGVDVLVGGMCETDFSGYPDCRDATIRAMQQALALGLDRSVHIETPLMWLSKAQTWAMAHQLGGDELVEILVRDTHTCYLGERGDLHDWGHGCGQCPACSLRKSGYQQWISNRKLP